MTTDDVSPVVRRCECCQSDHDQRVVVVVVVVP
jgi:hypothetical protein